MEMSATQSQYDSTEYRHLQRSRQNRVVLGVIGGIGEYFQVDPVILRVLTIVVAFASGFVPLLIGYLLVALVMPKEQRV